MIKVVLGCFALLCLAIVGCGVYFDAAIWGSLVGSFVGFWMGVIVSFVVQLFSVTATTRLRCMGYGVVIPAGLLFLLGLVSQQKTKRLGSFHAGIPLLIAG